MYNLGISSYSEDRRNLYSILGQVGISVISYSETSNIQKEVSGLMINEIDKLEIENSSESTQHAMNLTQSSLAEDWTEENDEHWDSFL